MLRVLTCGHACLALTGQVRITPSFRASGMEQKTQPAGDTLHLDPETRTETGSARPSALRRLTVMERSRGLRRVNLRELWEYRSLILTLIARHVQVRYAQSVLGVGWSLIRPLISMVMFTIVFERFVRVPSDGRPYPVFSLAAVVPWAYFSAALSGASESLTSSGSMITKVYFPRLVLPISFVAAALVDLAIGLGLLLLVLMWFGITPSVSSIVIVPLLIVAMMLTATGVGCVVTSLDIQYRDLKHVVPLLLQVWMYASPVVYPMSIVPESYRQLYALNPMAGTIATFRSVLLGTDAGDWPAVGRALASSALICAVGVVFFRYREPVFADVV